jgi:hypothetical protein
MFRDESNHPTNMCKENDGDSRVCFCTKDVMRECMCTRRRDVMFQDSGMRTNVKMVPR